MSPERPQEFPTAVIDYPSGTNEDVEVELLRDQGEPLGSNLVRMRLMAVVSGSPAERAGLQKAIGLSLLEIDGIPVNSEPEVSFLIAKKTALCLRFGLRNTINVHRLGNEVLGMSWDSSSYLTDVISNSAASKVGVEAFLNHKILSINGQPPNNSGIVPRGTVRLKFGHRKGAEPRSPVCEQQFVPAPVQRQQQHPIPATMPKQQQQQQQQQQQRQQPVPASTRNGYHDPKQHQQKHEPTKNQSVGKSVPQQSAKKPSTPTKDAANKTPSKTVRQPTLNPKLVSVFNEMMVRQARTEKVLTSLVSSLVPPPPAPSSSASSSNSAWRNSTGSCAGSQRSTLDSPVLDDLRATRQQSTDQHSRIKSIEIDLHQGRVKVSHRH